MMEINRSSSPEQVASLRATLTENGWVEAFSEEEAKQFLAEGKMPFIDHTKGGSECFSAAEMEDFRRTDCTIPGEFEAHLRRFKRL